jgi:cyanophycin synthetase
MITLSHRASWHGPNPLSDQPVIVVDAAIAEQNLAPLSQAIGALQTLSIDWYQPPKNLFAEPSNQASHQTLGSFLADWALQALIYVRGYLLNAGCRRTDSADKVQMWLGFHQAPLSFAALQLCAKWLCKLADGSATVAEFGQELTYFWQACRNRHPDYQARIIMEAARSLNIPYTRAWGLPRHWRFGQGARSRTFMETSSCDDGAFATRIVGSKAVTKTVLRSLGLPTPAAVLVKEESELKKALGQVGLPCVTKPIDCSQGRGVSTDLRSLDAVREGFRVARSVSQGPVLLEAFVPGNDYRLVVIEKRLLRCCPTVACSGWWCCAATLS